MLSLCSSSCATEVQHHVIAAEGRAVVSRFSAFKMPGCNVWRIGCIIAWFAIYAREGTLQFNKGAVALLQLGRALALECSQLLRHQLKLQRQQCAASGRRGFVSCLPANPSTHPTTVGAVLSIAARLSNSMKHFAPSIP